MSRVGMPLSGRQHQPHGHRFFRRAMIVVALRRPHDLEAELLVQSNYPQIALAGIGYDLPKPISARPGNLPALEPFTETSPLELGQNRRGCNVEGANQPRAVIVGIVREIGVALECATTDSFATYIHPVRLILVPILGIEGVCAEDLAVKRDERIPITRQARSCE